MFAPTMMFRGKIASIVFMGFACLVMVSCQKEGFITSPDASLVIGVDTLRFDTVFTSLGSVTRRFTLVNDNDQKLMISRISLAGGTTSAFSLNINGQATPQATNLELAANDSLYVFVRATIDPNNQNNAFVITDSIDIVYNGNTRRVQLQAYGQNARFINGGFIDANTTWDNLLPWVVLRPLYIDPGITLTIEKGTRVYFNATAPLIVNGTLRCLGDAAERIILRGDRLDETYRDYPGGWPGILFTNSSSNNLLQFTNVTNAFQAIVAVGGANAVPAKLTLQQCIIENAFDLGLLALNSSVQASNCRITQCGNDGQPGTGGSNLILAGGGQYRFEHCTIATFANFFQNHRQPAVYMSNSFNNQSAALNATFDNCIVWGEGSIVENEIRIDRATGPDFNVLLRHVLYRAKDELTNATLQNTLRNAPPLFDTINSSLRAYNFRLRPASPAIDAGRPTNLPTDLDGRPRVAGTLPDLGCYELQ